MRTINVDHVFVIEKPCFVINKQQSFLEDARTTTVNFFLAFV